MFLSGKKNYKYFIGYKDDDYNIKPLHIMLPKTSAYRKSYDEEAKWMYFLLKMMNYQKYNGIQNGITNYSKKELDYELICNKKFLKSKIRSYGDEAPDFQDKEVPNVGSNYTCLVILVDSVLKKDGNYFLQVFLKECKLH